MDGQNSRSETLRDTDWRKMSQPQFFHARFHLRHGKHLMSRLPHPRHDGEIQVFVGQKFHAA